MADAPAGRDYRETVFLPDLPGDPFPLRAGLPKKEPERVKHWADILARPMCVAIGVNAVLRRCCKRSVVALRRSRSSCKRNACICAKTPHPMMRLASKRKVASLRGSLQ